MYSPKFFILGHIFTSRRKRLHAGVSVANLAAPLRLRHNFRLPAARCVRTQPRLPTAHAALTPRTVSAPHTPPAAASPATAPGPRLPSTPTARSTTQPGRRLHAAGHRARSAPATCANAPAPRTAPRATSNTPHRPRRTAPGHATRPHATGRTPPAAHRAYARQRVSVAPYSPATRFRPPYPYHACSGPKIPPPGSLEGEYAYSSDSAQSTRACSHVGHGHAGGSASGTTGP